MGDNQCMPIGVWEEIERCITGFPPPKYILFLIIPVELGAKDTFVGIVIQRFNIGHSPRRPETVHSLPLVLVLCSDFTLEKRGKQRNDRELDPLLPPGTIHFMESAALSAERIRAALSTQILGRHLHLYDSIPSTNIEAKRFAAAGAPEGTLVIADEQTAGKGRHGRRWVAPARTCLLFSLVFRPSLLAQQVARLTMLASLATAEAIEVVTHLPVAIKWPNDLVISGPPGAPERVRKLGGILSETALSGKRLAYGIVGIGINVNVDPVDLGKVMTPATSLQAELGRPLDRISLLAGILEQIEAWSPELTGERIVAAWAERLITVGQRVVASQGKEPLEGYAEGVAPDGELLLRDLAGNLHRISAGDVTLRPPLNKRHST